MTSLSKTRPSIHAAAASGQKSAFNNSTPVFLCASMIVGIVSLYAPAISAAPIYKVIDEQTGQVTFTDRPQNYDQQAGKQISQTAITTGNSANTNADNTSNNANVGTNNTSPQLPSASSQSTIPLPQTATANKAPQANYQLTMTDPSAERAYRRPAQSIEVNLQLKPALQAGDSVSIYLDGKEVAQGLSTSIATVDILPGAHNVKAMVKSETGQTLKQVERTIYVIQNNMTIQNNKKIAQQLLAYQQLPWHQKLLLKLRQDDGNKQQVKK